MNGQTRWVTIDRAGKVFGPTGDSFEQVKTNLIGGYRRTALDKASGAAGVFLATMRTDEEVWRDIKKYGFKIKRVEIRILED